MLALSQDPRTLELAVYAFETVTGVFDWRARVNCRWAGRDLDSADRGEISRKSPFFELPYMKSAHAQRTGFHKGFMFRKQ